MVKGGKNMQLKNSYLTKIEICYLLGINPITLINWYRYIENTPPEEIPKDCPGLPPYKLKEDGKTKVWHGYALHQLYDFQKWIPRGRAGVMGKINEIYWKKEYRKGDNRKKNL